MKESQILSKLRELKIAARLLRGIPSKKKNQVLKVASRLLVEHQEDLLKANAKDLAAIEKGEVSAAFIDRLTLTPSRILHMSESLRQVADLPDPVGEIVEKKTLENGLAVERVRSPLGVIFMIFESRPNVALEAFSLAFKAGNIVILRGGKESMKTTGALYQILEEALKSVQLSKAFFWGIENPDRAISQFLLKQKQWIDVVVPRGGDRLIEFVTSNSNIPIIKNDRGLCHVYVHEDADLEMATQIVVNAKTQRPGVCNAMETLLVHRKVASQFLFDLYQKLKPLNVRIHACPKTQLILKGKAGVFRASSKSWDTEYLDLDLNCRIVDSLEEAIQHIETHGSRHSEAIITRSKKSAHQFQTEVDAAAVYWNASTRFTDGFEMGLGGELGISTQKLHVRGPVGLRELTSIRWLANGTGQIRN